MADGQQTKNAGAGCLAVFLLVIAIGAIASLLGLGDDNQVDLDLGATDVCHQAVEDRLRAPASAEFSGETVTHVGDDYTVTGVVDSENGFGAMLRSAWTCDATHVEGTRWNRISAVLIGE